MSQLILEQQPPQDKVLQLLTVSTRNRVSQYTQSPMEECFLLQRLPLELRRRIYELVLGFDHPVKLRQHVSGSPNIAVLCTNHQIYEEALAVFYDVNTIAVTRNDFCTATAASIKRPVDRYRAKHLLVTNFGQSLACYAKSCSVCSADGKGFIAVLEMMPRLQTVEVDFHNQLKLMRSTKEGLLSPSTGYSLLWRRPGCYSLRGPSLHSIAVEFKDRPVANAWSKLGNSASDSSTWRKVPANTLGARLVDFEILHKTQMLIHSHNDQASPRTLFPGLEAAWPLLDVEADTTEWAIRDSGASLHIFDEQVYSAMNNMHRVQ